MRARAWALAVCLGGGLPAARAADPTQTVVRTKGAQAAAAFKAGDFAEALTLYQAVEPLMATMEGREAELATLRFNIARCYDELKRPVEAVAAYRRALEGLEDAALVARIEARVATLEAESLGIIEVRCAAPGAVGYITQHDNLLPWSTVRTNITMGLKIRKVPTNFSMRNTGGWRQNMAATNQNQRLNSKKEIK